MQTPAVTAGAADSAAEENLQSLSTGAAASYVRPGAAWAAKLQTCRPETAQAMRSRSRTSNSNPMGLPDAKPTRGSARQITAALAGSQGWGFQILEGLHHALPHALLRAANPLPRVIIALVGLLRTFGISDLALQVGTLSLVELEQPLPIRPLRVSVHIHLHDAIAHRVVDVLFLGARASVEDEHEGIRVAHDGL